MSKVIFTKIVSGDIFNKAFCPFEYQNELNFSRTGITILYGPNGVGKSSLADVLAGVENSSYEVFYQQKKYTETTSSLFHVISDQKNRNIIKGETNDYLIGENIRREKELENEISSTLTSVFNGLNRQLKSNFGITAASSKALSKIRHPKVKRFSTNLANQRSKGKDIESQDFVLFIEELSELPNTEFDEAKLEFLVKDYSTKNHVIESIMDIGKEIIGKTFLLEIEEHSDAINILEKYDYKNECVVCDKEIKRRLLLREKQDKQRKVIAKLDPKSKKLLENIVEKISVDDPFHIKKSIFDAISKNDLISLESLIAEFEQYIDVYNIQINNMFADCLEGTKLAEKVQEHYELCKADPKFEDDDIRLIEEFVNDNMSKEVLLKREDGKLTLYLDSSQLLGEEDLQLSTGEQNFISLAFEFLKAKKSEAKIIVVDDPISSFDSIYKNKIAFMILKFLRGKEQIILTHNLDLVRLLEHQQRSCFNLYLFNNIDGEINGFIPVGSHETEILLHLDKLLELFRGELIGDVVDEKLFLIAMIPFLRGFSKLLAKSCGDKLSKVMHGYEEETINLSEIYNEIFGEDCIQRDYNISAQNIIDLDPDHLDKMEILKSDKYPLLNKTLLHNLQYLFLRMCVESTLGNLFQLDIRGPKSVGEIIGRAFRDNRYREERIFFNSRKTLLNEFNHFEGNINIFQPAIDITDSALKAEREAILERLEGLEKSNSS